jgi:hypothetical protein
MLQINDQDFRDNVLYTAKQELPAAYCMATVYTEYYSHRAPGSGPRPNITYLILELHVCCILAASLFSVVVTEPAGLFWTIAL